PEVALAETVHLHIKVDDTEALPRAQLAAAGAELDHAKPGFVKFRLPGAVNAIFSHIRVAQDDLADASVPGRSRPFLDHIGIDLRDESAAVRQVFAQLPAKAATLGWSVASQGGAQPVYCCHVEVAAKRWLYPPALEGAARVPLEFAYGALKVDPEKSGCDLRPADPSTAKPAANASCCGPAQAAATACAGSRA
ncbi:MAG: hypothetical protein M3Z16_09530, partial [Pseudomonadota bacterium]|nr:hypothetical protein [Pseudomonadota bacterium]